MRRLQIIAAALLTFATAGTAAAQGRIMGVVLDPDGRPIKGATVRALNADAAPTDWTASTDGKGRFVMLGLRLSDSWRFVAEAPGFLRAVEMAPVRSTFGPRPLVLTLARDPGPPPGSLSKGIVDDVAAANRLRDEGRLDQALTAYQAIATKNPMLTAIHRVIAGVYRSQADREPDAAARQALLARAAAAELAAASPELK